MLIMFFIVSLGLGLLMLECPSLCLIDIKFKNIDEYMYGLKTMTLDVLNHPNGDRCHENDSLHTTT